MRSTRVIYAATAAVLVVVGTLSVLIYRATEREVVAAFSAQQLAVARTVAVALDAEGKALVASLRQLNALPSVQWLDEPYIGQRVRAAFEPAPTGVLQVVRIGANQQRYTWSRSGELLESRAAMTPNAEMWQWSADRSHEGRMRIGPVWWDAAVPAHYRALFVPVWRVATSGPLPVPPNDFNGVLAFVVDVRGLLHGYTQPASIQAMNGTLSLDFGDADSMFSIGGMSPTPAAITHIDGDLEGAAVIDGYVWAWAHLPFADKTWGVTIGTPYDVASARVGEAGLRQLAVIGVLVVLVPLAAGLLVRRERQAEHERRVLELQLAQAQKMDAIGKLAGGIAHDFNNLLTAILGYTNLILEDVSAGTPAHQEATQVRRAAQSAAALTQKLLAFSRRQALHAEHIDLALLFKDIMLLVRRIVGEHVAVVCDLQPDLWPVMVDPVQVEQAVINLATNARDAMPNGGSLEIIVRNAPRSERHEGADQDAQPADYVQIVVRDTGIGMDESTRARMFEPFFTTKPKGKGTGLGLSSVWGIVTQSGGYINVASAPHAGTTIELFLPRASAIASSVTATGVAADEQLPGNETVLLVEDDDAVRDLARTSLERQGYHVLTAPGAEDALRIAHDYREGISLLLTDVRMPGMQGPELATRLRSMRPGLRVLFMSGYPSEAVTNEILNDAALLEKPFLPAVLTQAVRLMLDRHV
jgi:signal transduction histidine kinase